MMGVEGLVVIGSLQENVVPFLELYPVEDVPPVDDILQRMAEVDGKLDVHLDARRVGQFLEGGRCVVIGGQAVADKKKVAARIAESKAGIVV